MPGNTVPVSMSIMFILGLLMGLPPIATDLYLPAMPSIATALQAGPEAVQQTLTLYLLFFALAQLIFGPLSDARGRRLVMLVGLAIFGLGSVLCAFAGSIEALIGYRALQGIGAAAMVVTVPAVVRDQATGSDFSRVMGFIMLVMGVAPLIAPLIGSLILKLAGWRMIFLTLAAVTSLVTVLYLLKVGETLPRERRKGFDVPSVAKNYLAVIADRQAMCYMLCSALAVAAMFGFLAASPFVYIEFYGVSEQGYGLLFAANISLMLLMTSVSNRLVGRHGPRRMLGMAMLMILLSCLLLGLIANLDAPSLKLVVIAVMLFIGTAGVINANAMALVLARLGHISGSASAVAGSLRFGLGAVAPVVVGLLYDGTPVAMVLVMMGCGVLALACFLAAQWMAEPLQQAANS